MKRMKKVISNWIFLCRFAWGISRRVFAAKAVETVMDVAEPFAVLIVPKFIIDELTGQKRWEAVLGYILLLVGVLTLLRLVRLGMQVFCNMAVNGCDLLNVKHYSRFFLDMDFAKMEDGAVRDLQETIAGDVHANTVADTVQELATNTLRLGGYACLVFTLHPAVLFVVLAVAAVNYSLGFLREKSTYAFRPEQASAARKFNYLFETMGDFSFAKEVRINQASAWLAEKFSRVLDAYGGRLKKYQNRILILGCVEGVVNFGQLFLMYGYGVHQAVTGSITIGDFTVYTGAVLALFAAFSGFANGLTHMSYMSKYADKYKEYAEIARPAHLTKGTVRLTGEEKENVIEFRDVSFSYPHTERKVLDHISLVISDREKLAVVGINGAGKTTFIKLLCRLYEPTEGVILYNGTDISTIRYEDYVKKLSVVFQDFQLLAFSMEDNVVLNQRCDREKVLEAVRRSGLEDKLKKLPKGLDTSVGKDFDEEGVEFSGGEGQKLVTARAYYKNAPIVIFDEPTAALDPISENHVYQNFREIMKGKMAIFISHRLASTRFCDRIAVFRQGQIVEYGTHEQLMGREGLYREMFDKQAEYYKEAAK